MKNTMLNIVKKYGAPCLMMAFCLLVLPTHAYAKDLDLFGVNDLLQDVVDTLTGTTGRLISAIAVVFFGVMYMFGEHGSFARKAFALIIGIILITNALAFVLMVGKH